MALGWSPLSAEGILEIDAADDTLIVTDATGPITVLAAAYGKPVSPPAWTDALLTTSTSPGTAPDYLTSTTYLSYGTIGSPIIFQPGVYVFILGFFVQTSSNTGEWWVNVKANGVYVFPPASAPIGKASSQTAKASFVQLTVGVATPFYFDVNVAKGGGPGDITFKSAWVAATKTA